MGETYKSKALGLHKLFADQQSTVKKFGVAFEADGTPKLPKTFERAYLELSGIDTKGATFVGRVFFNNPDANENTPTNAENGYVGSFSVFGHGGCIGQEGHCQARPGTREFDYRPKKVTDDGVAQVAITDGLRKVLQEGTDVSFQIVPVILSAPEGCDTQKPLKFKQYDISLRFKNKAGKSQRVALVEHQKA